MIQAQFIVTNISIDHQRVNRAVDRGAKKAIPKALKSMQVAIITGYKRRKQTSKPGQSPSVHSNDSRRTLKNVMLEYDEQTKVGVVGPVLLRNSNSDVPLPGLLERGGTTTSQSRRKNGRFGKSRRVVIRPRPNVGLAFDREVQAGNVVTPWSNVVVG